MAQTKTTEYKNISGSNGLGQISLSIQVFELIIKNAIADLKETSLETNLGGLFNKKVINCDLANDELNVTVNIRMKYGIDIGKTSAKVQEKIYQALTEMTGVKPTTVTINVVEIIN